MKLVTLVIYIISLLFSFVFAFDKLFEQFEGIGRLP
jgi:hypothetical protein